MDIVLLHGGLLQLQLQWKRNMCQPEKICHSQPVIVGKCRSFASRNGTVAEWVISRRDQVFGIQGEEPYGVDVEGRHGQRRKSRSREQDSDDVNDREGFERRYHLRSYVHRDNKQAMLLIQEMSRRYYSCTAPIQQRAEIPAKQAAMHPRSP